MSTFPAHELPRDAVHCEFCGQTIESEPQDCPALDDGRCQP
ncbi:hypothetical protein [Halomicrobium mukohataei]|nr:hypothetical protein [Halomicrobium mukohataei]